jgi:GLPGLI family protein
MESLFVVLHDKHHSEIRIPFYTVGHTRKFLTNSTKNVQSLPKSPPETANSTVIRAAYPSECFLCVDLQNLLPKMRCEILSSDVHKRQLVAELKNTMRQLILLSILLLLIGTGCSSEPRKVTEGRVVYSIDYPNHKDNFFLYSILPKEMELNFKGNKMESRIQKANLKNILLVDCNKRQVGAYFEYGDDIFNVALNPFDVNNMVSDQKEYKIKFTNEESMMAGFNVKKALATAVKDPADKITLWYTEEIALQNPNWYNPFKEVPGFLLAYSIDRFGIRMVFKAKNFEEVEIPDSQFELEKKGVSIPYDEYNKRMNELFQSFD